MNNFCIYTHSEVPYLIKLLNNGSNNFYVGYGCYFISKERGLIFEPNVVLDDLSECGKYFHFDSDLCRVPTEQERQVIQNHIQPENICTLSRFDINFNQKFCDGNNESDEFFHQPPTIFSVADDAIQELTTEAITAKLITNNSFIQFKTMAQVVAFTTSLEAHGEKYLVKPCGLFFSSEGKIECDLTSEIQHFFGKEDYFFSCGKLYRKPTERESQMLEGHAVDNELANYFSISYGADFSKYHEPFGKDGLPIKHMTLNDEQLIPEFTKKAVIEGLEHIGCLKPK